VNPTFESRPGVPVALPPAAGGSSGVIGKTRCRISRSFTSPFFPTRGWLYIGELALATLELPWKDNLPNVSCIPPGIYRTVIAWSNRYRRLMPRLLDVPGRSGILIHNGKTAADTHGCVLVGMRFLPDGSLSDPRRAFGLFVGWLGVALRDGDVYTEIA
jgi:hypothetical protein